MMQSFKTPNLQREGGQILYDNVDTYTGNEMVMLATKKENEKNIILMPREKRRSGYISLYSKYVLHIRDKGTRRLCEDHIPQLLGYFFDHENRILQITNCSKTIHLVGFNVKYLNGFQSHTAMVKCILIKCRPRIL